LQCGLHNSRLVECLEMVKLLIDRGADINFKDKNGKTLLHYTSNVKLCELLIEHGADVNITDNIGRVKFKLQLAILKCSRHL